MILILIHKQLILIQCDFIGRSHLKFFFYRNCTVNGLFLLIQHAKIKEPTGLPSRLNRNFECF